MNNCKVAVGWLLVFMMVATVLIPVTPAYAFSLGDLLGTNSGNANTSDGLEKNSSGSGLANVLIGLLMGKLFGKSSSSNQSSSDTAVLSASQKNQGDKEVIGFYAEWYGTDTSSFTSMSKNVDTLKTIVPFWTTLQEDGTITDRGGNDHASVVKFAHQNNIKVLLMVNNAKQEGSKSSIHTVLSNPTLRSKAITNLEEYIKRYNLDGINIDFEMVPAEDRDNLSAFMREIAAQLKPQGYSISIDVFPKQDETNDVAIAYDYAQLAKYADKIMIMTYDNHGTWSGAGPIADINWVENNLKYALKFIPKNKLYLGVAGYGYDWSSKGVESLEHGALMNLVQKFNVPTIWDETSKSPHFAYTGADGVTHQVWYENSESLKYKLNLVNQYDIAGAALWKLGEEDPASWQVFKDKLLRK